MNTSISNIGDKRARRARRAIEYDISRRRFTSGKQTCGKTGQYNSDRGVISLHVMVRHVPTEEYAAHRVKLLANSSILAKYTAGVCIMDAVACCTTQWYILAERSRRRLRDVWNILPVICSLNYKLCLPELAIITSLLCLVFLFLFFLFLFFFLEKTRETKMREGSLLWEFEESLNATKKEKTHLHRIAARLISYSWSCVCVSFLPLLLLLDFAITKRIPVCDK